MLGLLLSVHSVMDLEETRRLVPEWAYFLLDSGPDDHDEEFGDSCCDLRVDFSAVGSCCCILEQ